MWSAPKRAVVQPSSRTGVGVGSECPEANLGMAVCREVAVATGGTDGTVDSGNPTCRRRAVSGVQDARSWSRHVYGRNESAAGLGHGPHLRSPCGLGDYEIIIPDGFKINEA